MTSVPRPASTTPMPRRERNILLRFFHGLMYLVDRVIDPIQQRIGVRGMAYLFVLPNLLIFGIFILFPMLLNFYYAFTGGTNLFPQDRPFVGTANLQMLFDCQDYLNPNTCSQDIFWRSVYNTVGFVILQVGGMIILGLITALALNRNIRARGFFRGVFFYPVLLSPVVVGLIWKWILQRDGVLNAVIVALGGERLPFLLNADWARMWVVLVSIWAQMGFYTLILLAGLQSIPAELYEAGQIDGANGWKSFRFITLPLLMPTMLVVTVLSLIRAVQVFDQPYVLTGGGPGTATNYIVQYIYRTGFDPNVPQYGLAATASMVLALVLLLLTLGQLRLGRNTEYS
jgi:alpha-1,4-digalacturonate transport system permease protein